MIIDKITQKFIDSPNYLGQGAGFLAKKWKCEKEDIYKAKLKAKDLMKLTETTKLQSIIADKDRQLATYIGGKMEGENQVKTFETTRPLTPQEIEELAGVDGITTEVARVWDKLQMNGMWTYSIDIRYKIKDFYNKEQLQEKLKELFPDQTPYTLPHNSVYSDKALVICLADDHVGAVNTTNIFDNTVISYKEKLRNVIEECMNLGSTFEEVHIISLGDQLNGHNSKTTRGGHEVKSVSNKEQFDEYCSSRVDFYSKLFSSGVGNTYYVHDVENSNHSGLGFSYMANQYLDMFLEAKFPQVVRRSIHDMIDGFEYGKHVILMGHGKDEQYQKRPFPAVLDAKTDLFLYDYSQSKEYSPYKSTITFYKGDLHQLGVQMGKFGRYVNVQSIIGNTDYGDSNFGNTRAGALIEILDKQSYKITSQAIWF